MRASRRWCCSRKASRRDGPSSQELRLDIDKFKKSGKPVFAYLRQPGTREYYVACGADRIYLGPSEPVMVKGLRAEMMYFKKTLDKIGVSVEIEHAGKYKDFGDMFTRSDMSPETREVMTSVVDDLYGNLVAGIAAGRRKSPDEVRAIIDQGPFTAPQALKAGLVDELALRRPDVGRTEGPAQGRAFARFDGQVLADHGGIPGTCRARATSRSSWAKATSCAAIRATMARAKTA